tara:strand:+ start:203 stop:517 length:315 start_codon:yes stop_codon:yes gene_type:complete
MEKDKIMGAFDTVRCFFKMPVPDDETCDIDFNSLIYQTKDLNRGMDVYTISKKGKIHVDGEFYKKTSQFKIYSICDGYWVEYEISLDEGKVARIELTDYRNSNF